MFLSAPNDVIWDVTNRCNLRCKHCYVSGGSSAGGELTTSEAKYIVDQLARNKVFRLSFTGGEPLIRGDIFELIAYAREKGMLTILASNGWMIDEKCAHKLKKTGLNYILISLDGQDEKTHDFIRGPDSFRRVIIAAKNLRESGIPFGFTLVLNRLNFRQVEAVAQLGASLEANELRLFRLIEVGRAKEHLKQGLTPNEIRQVLTTVRRLKANIHVSFDEAFAFLTGFSTERIFQGVGCSAARTVMGIRALGDVTPCPMLVDHEFYSGNMLSQSFENIWRHSPILNFFRNINKLKGKCDRCQFLEKCGGGCRAASYAKTGDILASDYGCWYEKEE